MYHFNRKKVIILSVIPLILLGTGVLNANDVSIGRMTNILGTWYGTKGTSDASGTNSVAIGSHSKASGDNSTAIGSRNKASGDNSTATGNSSYATGDNSTATGFRSTATGDNSTATGSRSKARGDNSSAYGADAVVHTGAVGSSALGQGAVVIANVRSSVALGQDSVATESNTISVGGAGNKRRITNVADGLNGTDAVNVSQLSTVDTKVTTNTGNIATNRTYINTNTNNITTNRTDINTNTAGISTNTVAIDNETSRAKTAETANASNIATNTNDIVSNKTSITANTKGIANNWQSIKFNEQNIAYNTNWNASQQVQIDNLDGRTSAVENTILNLGQDFDNFSQFAVDSAAGSMSVSTIDFGTVDAGHFEVGVGVGMSGGNVINETSFAGGAGLKYGFTDETAGVAKGWVGNHGSYGAGAGMVFKY